MEVKVLGSSSKGNSTYIKLNDTEILIDVGYSMKYIENKLLEYGTKLENIKYILITHEHIDHIKSLGAILRKYDLKVFIAKECYDISKDKIGNILESKLIYIKDYDKIYLDNVEVIPIEVNHDAIKCFAYKLSYNDEKIGYITDTGRINTVLLKEFEDINILLIESNYDYEMLILGKYPFNIKSRIKSVSGHLSNEDTYRFIKKIEHEYLNEIHIMHISEENNDLNIVNNMVDKIKKEYKEEFKKDIKIYISN